jgi:putative transposase
MHIDPISSLHWAYQLHYYLCVGTYRRNKLFSSNESVSTLSRVLEEICARHDYHLLRFKIYPEHLRCLLSLQPHHDISAVIRTLKANSSRQFCVIQSVAAPTWARGFLAQSVGKARVEAVRNYLNEQAEHHGYSNRVVPPVFRYKPAQIPNLTAAHSSFELNHHLVFATRHRRGVFTSALGAELASYWQRVAARHGFAIERISVLPDHIHLLVRTIPRLGIEACALALMNNGQHFIAKAFPQALIEAGLEQLWQPSAYAGTTGTVTTALVKAFLTGSQ